MEYKNLDNSESFKAILIVFLMYVSLDVIVLLQTKLAKRLEEN